MKIAIVSDSHDHMKNIEKFMQLANKKKFDAIIHCGDLCGPSAQILMSNIPFHFAFGNIDRGAFELYTKYASNKNIHIYNPFGDIELDGKKIAFIHYPELAYGLACTKKYDAVFYGHNHLKKSEKVGDCLLVNPGPLNGFKYKHPEVKATYAIYDTKTNQVEIKNL